MRKYHGSRRSVGRFICRAPEEESDPVYHKCVARRVQLPWILKPGKHGFLKTLVESDCPAAVFGTPVVRAVIQYKWRRFGQRIFSTESFFHVLQITTFTLFALLYSDAEPVSCGQIIRDPAGLAEEVPRYDGDLTFRDTIRDGLGDGTVNTAMVRPGRILTHTCCFLSPCLRWLCCRFRS